MYFKQAFKGENDWWRYLVVTLLVFIGYNVGGIPLELARLKLQDQNAELGSPDLSTFMQNFEQFGINTNLGLTLMLVFFVAAITVFYFVFSPLKACLKYIQISLKHIYTIKHIKNRGGRQN